MILMRTDLDALVAGILRLHRLCETDVCMCLNMLMCFASIAPVGLVELNHSCTLVFEWRLKQQKS